ncbi:hypothetical protein WDW86_08280 [Bdellovibrionota bacterium FG-2]
MAREKFHNLLSFCAVAFALGATVAPRSSQAAPLREIPPARTVEESKALFESRADAFIRDYAGIELGFFGTNGRHFTVISLARLHLGQDIELINQSILDPRSFVYALVGSDFHDLGKLFERNGDYDFALRGLEELVFHFANRPDLLWPEARQKIVYQLMTETGNKFTTSRRYVGFIKWNETENHILLTESSRFLTNQIRLNELKAQGKYDAYFDNDKNGMSAALLRFMQNFLKRDFDEFNSRPYQKLSISALSTLFEHSQNPKVKLMAEMVLNYLDAKFAATSKSLRRSVPFQRQPSYADSPNLVSVDQESTRMALMAGNIQHLGEMDSPYSLDTWTLIAQALGTYRVPDMILDLIVRDEEPGRVFFQRFHHKAFEAYSGSPSFLISAGGKYKSEWDFFTKQLSSWAVPTTLIPAREGVSRDQMIRIEGLRLTARHNLCVAPGFACGVNLVIPRNIPATCRETVGAWTFVNFTASDCPLQYGFFVAAYAAPCTMWDCKKVAENFGFFEAAEPSPGVDFAEFKKRVLAKNGAARFKPSENNTYTTSQGVPVVFEPLPSVAYDFGIHAWNNQKMDLYEAHWPFAQGDYIQADGSGMVMLTNPYLRKRIILDGRDALNPWRGEVDL